MVITICMRCTLTNTEKGKYGKRNFFLLQHVKFIQFQLT